MRKILYPFFLLSLIAGVYYFFGENFAPLMQKILLVLGLAFGFFLFRGLFLFFFDWIFESFSNLFKTIISAILFFLVMIALWGSFPENITKKISDIFSSDTEIGQGLSSFGNGTTENFNIAKKELGEKISDTTDALQKGGKDIGEGTKDALDSDLSLRTPTHLLKNVKILPVSDEQESSEKKAFEISSDEATIEVGVEEKSVWKKPVIAYLPEKNKTETEMKIINTSNDSKKVETEKSLKEKTIIEKNKARLSQNEFYSENRDEKSGEKGEKKITIDVKKMKKSGVKLVSSGPRKEDYTVVLREMDAQIVFPVEYTVSQVIWTDSDSTLDQVDFNVQTPTDTVANISIALSDSGTVFEKYFAVFQNNDSSENQFFISEKSENSLTYVTFFEGILWEITIKREGESLQEKDFYDILLPISFQKEG